MLNMKKVLIAGTVLTALCATAFAATNDEAQKPTMKERVSCILAEGRTDCPAPQECRGPREGMGRHHKDFRKMSPEQRAEMEKRRAEWEKMTPEQRREAHEKWQKEREERRAEIEKARQERHDQRAKETMSKLTPEQKAEVEAFIKEDMAQREARRAKLQNMTPEQREAVRANRPLKPSPLKDGKHFRGHGPQDGKHFQGHGPMHPGPRPDCPVAPSK